VVTQIYFMGWGRPYSAGQQYEQAGQMAKQEKQFIEAAELMKKASQQYHINANADRAADVIAKAAKLVEDVDAEKALELYEEALELFESEEKQSADTIRLALSFAIRSKKFTKALELLERQAKMFLASNQDHSYAKTALSIMIIHLVQDDYVAADKAYQHFLDQGGFARSNECRAAAALLDAFEKTSPSLLQAALSQQTFTFLDNQVLRLAKTLSVSESYSTNSQPTKAEPEERNKLFGLVKNEGKENQTATNVKNVQPEPNLKHELNNMPIKLDDLPPSTKIGGTDYREGDEREPLVDHHSSADVESKNNFTEVEEVSEREHFQKEKSGDGSEKTETQPYIQGSKYAGVDDDPDGLC